VEANSLSSHSNFEIVLASEHHFPLAASGVKEEEISETSLRVASGEELLEVQRPVAVNGLLRIVGNVAAVFALRKNEVHHMLGDLEEHAEAAHPVVDLRGAFFRC
jgi:hypothetical protein